MFVGVQIIGIIFGLIMIYLSYIYYRRGNYTYRSYLVWVLVWLAMLFLIIMPTTVYGIMDILEIQRTADFFVMAGFAFFSVMIFYQYTVIKTMNQKVERLVRTIAIRNPQKKKRK